VVNDVGDATLIGAEFESAFLAAASLNDTARVTDIIDANGVHAFQIERADGSCTLLWRSRSDAPVVVIDSQFTAAVGYLSRYFDQLPDVISASEDTVRIGFSGPRGIPSIVTVTGDASGAVSVSGADDYAEGARTCLAEETWDTFEPAPHITR
jgi:hypothetical protein